MAQISLTFPDGNIRQYPAGVTPLEVAQSIAPSLAKASISAQVDGKHWDLAWPIHGDAKISLNTLKDEGPALELIRHDLAHIMARAVQEIWPDVRVTIGPVRDYGWFYDFDRAEPFTPEDLGQIEAKMKQIINAREPVRTEVWPREKAVEYYRGRQEPFKLELAGTRRCLQADPCRRGLLAGRCLAAHVATHLRCRLPQPRRPEGPPDHAGGGRETRPPQAWPRDGAFPHPGRSAGDGVLAPERLDDLSPA